MKKFAKLTSVLLAVVMIVGMIPMIVSAEEAEETKTYTRVTTLDELTDGNYVVVLENNSKYYAMTDAAYNVGTEVTLADDLQSVSGDLFTWNLRVQDTTEGSKTVTLHNNGKYWYRTLKNTATLGYGIESPEWTVTAADSCFRFKSVNVDAYISINGTSIKGYDSTKRYNTNVLLFKEADRNYVQVSKFEAGGQYAVVVHFTNRDGVDIYRAMDTAFRINDEKIASASISADAVNDVNGTINGTTLPVWTFDGGTIHCGDTYLDYAGDSTKMSFVRAEDKKAVNFSVEPRKDVANTFNIVVNDDRNIAYRYNDGGGTIYNLFAAYAVKNDKDRGTTSQYDFHLYLYKVVEGAAVIGSTGYADITTALATAQSGETVVMLDNAVINDTVAIPNGVTLDLNGHNLGCTRLTADEGANVIDSSANHSGKVTVPSGSLTLRSTNTYLPIIAGENTYRFVDVKMQYQVNARDVDYLTLIYKPSLGTDLNALLADGGEAEGVKVGIRLTYTTAEGTFTTDFYNNANYYDDVYGDGGKVFRLTVTGLAEYESVQIQTIVTSNTGVTVSSEYCAANG